MRYIDSGGMNADQALAAWIERLVEQPLTKLRWQTGYFGWDGLTPLLPILDRLSAADAPVDAVLGSNDGTTVTSHVSNLARSMRLPRSAGRLGIVSYAGSLFHPKTYHVSRADGSQAAYVGSANLGYAGLSGLNVEAGILLDTLDGDPTDVLDAIAAAIEAWFVDSRAGFERVAQQNDVVQLQEQGVLATSPDPRGSGTGGGPGSRRPRRTPLFAFKKHGAGAPRNGMGAGPSAKLPTTRAGYPSYVLFAPDRTTPTVGPEALSGSLLPHGARGIVFRLNRDNLRHWYDGAGTANISIPVPMIGTLSFGLYSRDAGSDRKRPRAEFQQHVRYLSKGGGIYGEARPAGIMVYGHTPGDTGHSDTRLVVPAPLVTGLRTQVVSAHLPLPVDEDAALLEWPTIEDPTVRLSFIDRRTDLFRDCAELIAEAERTDRIVGRAACWLPQGIAPVWAA